MVFLRSTLGWELHGTSMNARIVQPIENVGESQVQNAVEPTGVDASHPAIPAEEQTNDQDFSQVKILMVTVPTLNGSMEKTSSTETVNDDSVFRRLIEEEDHLPQQLIKVRRFYGNGGHNDNMAAAPSPSADSPLTNEDVLEKDCVSFKLSKPSTENKWFHEVHASINEKGWEGSRALIADYLERSAKDLSQPEDNVPMWPVATVFHLKAEGLLYKKISITVSSERDNESPVFSTNEWNEFLEIARTGRFRSGKIIKKDQKIYGSQVDGFKITMFCEED